MGRFLKTAAALSLASTTLAGCADDQSRENPTAIVDDRTDDQKISDFAAANREAVDLIRMVFTDNGLCQKIEDGHFTAVDIEGERTDPTKVTVWSTRERFGELIGRSDADLDGIPNSAKNESGELHPDALRSIRFYSRGLEELTDGCSRIEAGNIEEAFEDFKATNPEWSERASD